MNAIDNIIKNINKGVSNFEDIPKAEDVKTQSHAFDRRLYDEGAEIKKVCDIISSAIVRKEDYVWYAVPQGDIIKFYICRLIPFLNKQGYDVIYIINKEDYNWHEICIIWDNYDYCKLCLKKEFKDEEMIEYRAIKEN